jgi:hypothetical protein
MLVLRTLELSSERMQMSTTGGMALIFDRKNSIRTTPPRIQTEKPSIEHTDPIGNGLPIDMFPSQFAQQQPALVQIAAYVAIIQHLQSSPEP